MTENERNTLNTKHKGLVIMKTASQLGSDEAFNTFADYVECVQGTREAHKIIEVERVEELKGVSVEIDYNHFGIPFVVVGGEELTISKFFTRYAY